MLSVNNATRKVPLLPSMRRPEFRLWTPRLAMDMMMRGPACTGCDIVDPDTEDTEDAEDAEEENGGD